MATIPEAFAVAIDHHRAGRIHDAEVIYRRILDADPQFPDAWHMLGVVACQVGKFRNGVECIQKCLDLRPDWLDACNNLGNAYRDLKQPADAARAFRRALELKPDSAETLNNLGNALQDQGEFAEAATCYKRALHLNRQYAEAYQNLGTLWCQAGQYRKAIACCGCAVRLNPLLAEAQNTMGNSLAGLGKFEAAASFFQEALRLKPDSAVFWNNHGNLLVRRGDFVGAAEAFQKAVRLDPNYAEAYNNLGNLCREQADYNAATQHCERAVQLRPDYSEAWNNLGLAYSNQNLRSRALACFEKAIQLRPGYAEVYNNLANVLKDLRRIDESVAAYRKAVDLKPDYVVAHSNLLQTIQYGETITLADLAAEHAEFERRYCAPLRTEQRPFDVTRDPDRPLRIGFVSPDLGRHPVGYFLIGVIENFRSTDWEIICYSNRIKEDELTQRFRAAAKGWRNVCQMDDVELAEKIREDRIDILFDLTGHTSRNRLLAFARKPAPLQLNWAGYEGTTGLAAIDCVVADRFEVPEGAEGAYCERILRMPDGYVCYEPPEYAPPVSLLPAQANGSITFGSFNNPAKITSKTIDLWGAVLSRVPNSRLVLKYAGFNDPAIADPLTREFAKRGINQGRIGLLGWSDHADSLAAYHKIDIALDTFPYNGCLTTCEAIWMGVPVVTLPGETFAARHSISLLAAAGATEAIARDDDDYVQCAVRLATDIPRLAELRTTLRDRTARSPLCDAAAFTKNLQIRLRAIWKEWCAQE